MDRSCLSQLPHHSWFGFSFGMQPTTTVVFENREVTHTLALGTGGAVDVRWTLRGRERDYHHGLDQIAFFACDHEVHRRVIRSAGHPASCYVLKIPKRHLSDLAVSDEAGVPGECRSFMPCEDTVLRECLRLLATTAGREVAEDVGSDIAARRLVLRLSELMGGKKPDWHEDASSFATRDMKHIVDYIDSHLHRHICLGEIAAIVSLSPSHCARKFRHMEGESLGRFINRRRLAAAMVVLRDDSVPLARLAIEIGFSSQSHLTRLFSELTGMTPASYRRQFRRSVG